MKITITSLFITFILFSTVAASFGQALQQDTIKQIPRSYWVSAGLGISTLGSISGGAALNAQISNQWLITASAQSETNTFLNFSSSPNADVNTFSVLAGKIFKKKFFVFTVSAGIAFVNVYTYSNSGIYDTYSTTGLFSAEPVYSNNRYTVGIPIIAQFYFVPVKVFGIGLSAYVNLNPVQTTAGFTVSMAIGRIGSRNMRHH